MGSLPGPGPAPTTTTTTPRRTKTPLHDVIPPLILGTATFNTQYVNNPYDEADLPALSIVSRALDLGVNAFDTSPYYGPSELILGAALAHPSVTSRHPRESYFLVTKCGRIEGDVFDYSPAWVRYSVLRSLERLHTSHLDLVYTHDVEFVSPAEVLAAVTELRALRDEGLVKYVGISGFPVETLASLAEMILRETGEPLDAVLSYGHCTVQCNLLGSEDMIRRFRDDAGVDVVLSASMLGMGLLTTRGVDAGPMAKWHPSPDALRKVCTELVGVAAGAKEKLEVVAIRWALDTWSRLGASLGTTSLVGTGSPARRVGVSVMGVSSVAELEETQRVFNSVLEGLDPDAADPAAQSDAAQFKRQWSLNRVRKIQGVVEQMWEVLGSWKDYAWSSPEPGFVNQRRKEDAGAVPRDDGVLERYEQRKKVVQVMNSPTVMDEKTEVVEVSVHEVQPIQL
ncbi:L-galactose dehydrogenase [Microdochium bolleyi]|uniref:L-galactose dehydrogenase n=1 Tax=Microdochium bolleyi TaxID=196109 RepID=A0A136IY86_9PEZI|nr:L-galactose dehydrogenase [Microdochium bolleyi]